MAEGGRMAEKGLRGRHGLDTNPARDERLREAAHENIDYEMDEGPVIHAIDGEFNPA